MRQWLCVTLGTWHPYKQATTIVWRYGLARWFGPFVHYLNPDRPVTVFPKLITMVGYMSYMRLAYPQVKPVLDAAITEIGQPETVAERIAHSNLVDLRSVMEHMMPVVSVVWYVTSNRGWR